MTVVERPSLATSISQTPSASFKTGLSRENGEKQHVNQRSAADT